MKNISFNFKTMIGLFVLGVVTYLINSFGDADVSQFAFVAGTFTASAYQNIKIAAKAMFNQEVWSKQWAKAGKGTWNDIVGSQAIRLGGDPRAVQLSNGRFCQAIDVFWLQDTNTPATIAPGTAYSDDNGDCTFDGTELGSDSKQYATAPLAVSRRKVVHSRCKNMIEFNDMSAQAVMNIKKELEIEAEKQLLSFIIGARKTIGLASADYTGTIVGDNWALTTADIKPELIAELKRAADVLHMVDPVIVSGSVWYDDKTIANATKGGSCCNIYSLLSAEDGFANTHNVYDLETLAGAKNFYLVDMATIMFVPATENENAAPTSTVADTFEWKDQLINLRWNNGSGSQLVPIDMRMKRVCEGRRSHSDRYEGLLSGVFGEAPLNDSGYPNVVEFTVT